jgi:serine O-acetyltransferase
MSTAPSENLAPSPPLASSRNTSGETTVSAATPDWSREKCSFGKWEPGKRLLRAIRRYQYWKGRAGPVGWLLSKSAVLSHRYWSAVTGADIPLTTRIAGGLSIPHPNGIVINPASIIGPNCLIFQQVTLGYGGSVPGSPTIGGHVDIGAGAKILGGITIGDHAKIGANAVVLTNVAAGATAVGIPARVIPPDRENAQ